MHSFFFEMSKFFILPKKKLFFSDDIGDEKTSENQLKIINLYLVNSNIKYSFTGLTMLLLEERKQRRKIEVELLKNISEVITKALNNERDNNEYNIRYSLVDQATIEKIFFIYYEKTYFLNIELNCVMNSILSTMFDPNIINQMKTNLCGVAIFLQYLASYKPNLFVQMALNIYLYGESNVPFFIDCKSNDFEYNENLLLVIMKSIRDTENILSYNSTSFMEPFLAATLPKELVTWIEKSEGVIRYECMRMVDVEYKEISGIKRTILGRGEFYSKHHQKQTSSEELLSRLKDAINNNDFCIIHISNRLCIYLARGVKLDQIDTFKTQTILGIQEGHYVRLLSINDKEDVEGKMKLTISSWGNNYRIYLTREEFAKHIHGCINAVGSSLKIEEKKQIGSGIK